MRDKQSFEISVDISWNDYYFSDTQSTWNGETTEKVIIDEGLTSYEDIISAAFNQAKDVGIFEEFEDITEEDCEYDVRIIDSYLENLGITDATELEEFCDIFYSKNNYYDIDVFKAAYDAGIPFESIEDSYAGEWDDDEDFIQTLLEDTGDLPKDLPHYIHIDWESTARDMMIDYTESDGHYFRNY